MSREYEEPVVTKTPNDNMHDSVERHPAYGLIGASRVSGAHQLYGSDFTHHSAVRITIRGSELCRGLNRDYHAARDEYIEVSLTESQWAEFVSTLNSGVGAPCTVEFVRGVGHLPGIKRTVDRRAQFASEARKQIKRSLGHLDKLLKALDEANIGKQKKEELVMAAKLARQDIEANIPFVVQSFDEHMETQTQRAKTEIHAYMGATLQRAGLEALKAQLPLLMPGEEDDDGKPR